MLIDHGNWMASGTECQQYHCSMTSNAVINAWTTEVKSDSISDIDMAKVLRVNFNDQEAIYDYSLLLGLDLSQGNAPLSVGWILML
jgi:hypothetical protein